MSFIDLTESQASPFTRRSAPVACFNLDPKNTRKCGYVFGLVLSSAPHLRGPVVLLKPDRQ
jgi:hypothetical protein